MTIRAPLIVVAILSTALMVTSACATILISGDNGGLMENYTARYRQVRQSGERVVIDGACLSACTMVLGLVPHDRVCATANAILGFHAAWQYDKSGGRVASPSGTRDLMKTYPPSVRAWIFHHGGLTPHMMFVRGRDLAAIVTPCRKASQAASLWPASRVDRARHTRRVDPRRASAEPH